MKACFKSGGEPSDHDRKDEKYSRPLQSKYHEEGDHKRDEREQRPRIREWPNERKHGVEKPALFVQESVPRTKVIHPYRAARREIGPRRTVRC